MCDAWAISGSSHSVNDPMRWIRSLEAFVRVVIDEGQPLVGICFGHQLIARALGGTVRSHSSWSLGVKRVSLEAEASRLFGGTDFLNLVHSHREIVTEIPRGATVIGHTQSCPTAMVSFSPNALGIQGHPEMTAAYARNLIEDRRGDVIFGL